MRSLSKNVISNMIFLSLGGIAGLCLYVCIVTFDSLSVLGNLNQILAIFIVLSQLGTSGIQHALQQRLAIATDPAEENTFLTSGLLIVLVSSTIMTVILFLLRNPLEYFFDSKGFSTLVSYSLLGFFLFNMNKAFAGACNGLNRMKLHGAIFGLRPILYLVVYLAIIFSDTLAYQPSMKIAAMLSVAEFLIFIFVFVNFINRLTFMPKSAHIKDLFTFGLRSCWMGVFTELNSRVDVICIGFFMSEFYVGLYSFALAIYEGLLQVLTVLRNNLNPILAKSIQSSPNEIGKLILTSTKEIYPKAFFSCLFLAGIQVYLFIEFPTSNSTLTFMSFNILFLGLFVVSGIYPFGTILIQANRPGIHSLISFGAFIGNVILNIILIPILGLGGAALATTISLVLAHICFFVFYNSMFSTNLFAQMWPLTRIFRLAEKN